MVRLYPRLRGLTIPNQTDLLHRFAPTMPEHLIRLRAAWEAEEADPTDGTRRVDLPASWSSGPSRLRRFFRPPPLDPALEALTLRLERVPGLESVRLNGRELARPGPGVERLEILLEADLPARNLLELALGPAARAAPAEGWGAVALVIRPAGPAPAD